MLLNFNYNTLKTRWCKFTLICKCGNTQNKMIKYVALVKEKNKAVQRNIHVQNDIHERLRE